MVISVDKLEESCMIKKFTSTFRNKPYKVKLCEIFLVPQTLLAPLYDREDILDSDHHHPVTPPEDIVPIETASRGNLNQNTDDSIAVTTQQEQRAQRAAARAAARESPSPPSGALHQEATSQQEQRAAAGAATRETPTLPPDTSNQEDTTMTPTHQDHERENNNAPDTLPATPDIQDEAPQQTGLRRSERNRRPNPKYKDFVL